MYKTGVIKTSRKENEKRIPVYPEHLPWIDEKIRKHLWFETGYGADYGFPDSYFLEMAGGVMTREEIVQESKLIILPKPVARDLEEMHSGQILWGWPHCVQQKSITQPSLNNKLTLIAWEAMHSWSPGGEKRMHVFYKNNELAGYAAVHHALQLTGRDGFYGPRRTVVVLGYGSVSRGAIHALHGRGFNNILVLTCRPTYLVGDQHPDCYYAQMTMDDKGVMQVVERNAQTRPLIDVLADADIIYNGVLQDINNPMMFVQKDQVAVLKPRSLIIDVSCDEGMGFPFARPTSFEQPVFTAGNGITYYSVDHTPAYLWDAASREISRALIPYLETVMSGPEAWMKNETVRRAIEIENGEIRNANILSFQNRSAQYPYEVLS